ncbi:MAG: hypothetical protein WDA26_12585 [Pusillimonas sp.]
MIANIISIIGSLASISGVSFKDLRQNNSNKNEVEKYIKYLEAKKVLTEPFENEVLCAVIRSLEDIKAHTEKLRVSISDNYLETILLNLILALSESLMAFHKLDSKNTKKDQYKMYRELQKVRVKFANAIAILVSAYDIDLSNSRLSSFVLDLAFHAK